MSASAPQRSAPQRSGLASCPGCCTQACAGRATGCGHAHNRQTRRRQGRHPLTLAALLGVLTLPAGCLGPAANPMPGLDRQLETLGPSQSPSLGDGWLALISHRGGRDQVVLINLTQQRPEPLPGLNRADARPLMVAVDNRGERLAVLRQQQGRTDVVLYRRQLMLAEVIPLVPAGVPERLQLRADGRELVVQVSREGRRDLDLIPLP